jgi:hypothetical protein
MIQHEIVFNCRKSEAMNRPKKEFIPTSLSDLNIDSISLGSNSDRHNNNSNGARFNNLDRSKATSSFNLSSSKSSHHINNNNFSRASKMYGSQSNISGTSTLSYPSVNNLNLNSPTSSTKIDPWEQAWEDNNNTYRPPSYHQQKREHSVEKSKQTIKHSHTTSFDFKRSPSINQSQVTSNRSMNHYVEDPFDDPWSGMSSAILLLSFVFCTIAPTQQIIRHHHHCHMVMETRMNRSSTKCIVLFVIHAHCSFNVFLIIVLFASSNLI